jgi:hypothetical protein
MQPDPPDHFDIDAEPPSKSARKRAHKALQDLGSELMNLSNSQLARIPLREDLREVAKARGPAMCDIWEICSRKSMMHRFAARLSPCGDRRWQMLPVCIARNVGVSD